MRRGSVWDGGMMKLWIFSVVHSKTGLFFGSVRSLQDLHLFLLSFKAESHTIDHVFVFLL